MHRAYDRERPLARTSRVDVDGRVIAPATALEPAAEWSGAIGT
jgi:hypothetical protein